jgi:hypothetical protein
MDAAKLRLFILSGWFVAFVMIALAYLSAYYFEPIKPSIETILSSAAIVVGLTSPHLTMLIDAVLDNKEFENTQIDRSAALVSILSCLIYWCTFITITWAGVYFRAFSINPDGSGIDKATSIVSGIVGIISFLAIRPTTRLFKKK